MSGYVGVPVECPVCGRQKKPHDRSAPLGSDLCSRGECPAYDDDPLVGCLWPGETCEDFGRIHCHVGVQACSEVKRG